MLRGVKCCELENELTTEGKLEKRTDFDDNRGLWGLFLDEVNSNGEVGLKVTIKLAHVNIPVDQLPHGCNKRFT